MRLAVLVNDVVTESPMYTTTALIRTARARGHEVFILGVEDLVHDSGHVCAWAREAPEPTDTAEAFMAAVREQDRTRRRRITIDDFDVLLLRNNPYDDLPSRPWAAQVGLIFGQEAQRHGVIVLNDPVGLSGATSKLYLEHFPSDIRPKGIVTRRPDDVREMMREHGAVVVKPLTGYGGRGVFVLRDGDDANFNQILEAVSGFGYVMVQEYLEEAQRGDVRLLLLDGRPLIRDGRLAAIRRIAASGDLRNNIKAGGRAEAVEVTDDLLRIAELARPRLTQDGMWLVGLDVVGDKVLEVNVFSTGGVVGATRLYGVDFASSVIESLERKVAHAARGPVDNRVLACV